MKSTTCLAQNDPGKLYSANKRKAASWAVMDADTQNLRDNGERLLLSIRRLRPNFMPATAPARTTVKEIQTN